MKILSINDLEIPDVKVIRFQRFQDNRGYFTEHFSKINFDKLNIKIVQANSSYSKKGVLRGIHYQWNQNMGKLIRVLFGKMIDIAVDLRVNSPTFGKGLLYKMEFNPNLEYDEWIWVPPGFGHGNYYYEDSSIEYLCTGLYNSQCEAGIYPLCDEIDWSLTKQDLFSDMKSFEIMSERDKNGIRSLTDNTVSNFQYILVTGGSGLLGTELKKSLNAYYPTSKEFNLLDYNQMDNYLDNSCVKIILHCAAAAKPPLIEKEFEMGIDNNIIGTCNLTKLASKYNCKLIYISTDYVFNGEKGNYDINDPVFPINKYGWSKLGGESAVRMYDNHLIIRLSFGPTEFPYPKAFIDQYTSRETVDKITEKIIKVLYKNGTIHLGSEKRSVYEYSIQCSPEKNIEPISINDMNYTFPKDTSLKITKI